MLHDAAVLWWLQSRLDTAAVLASCTSGSAAVAHRVPEAVQHVLCAKHVKSQATAILKAGSVLLRLAEHSRDDADHIWDALRQAHRIRASARVLALEQQLWLSAGARPLCHLLLTVAAAALASPSKHNRAAAPRPHDTLVQGR